MAFVNWLNSIERLSAYWTLGAPKSLQKISHRKNAFSDISLPNAEFSFPVSLRPRNSLLALLVNRFIVRNVIFISLTFTMPVNFHEQFIDLFAFMTWQLNTLNATGRSREKFERRTKIYENVIEGWYFEKWCGQHVCVSKQIHKLSALYHDKLAIFNFTRLSGKYLQCFSQRAHICVSRISISNVKLLNCLWLTRQRRQISLC